MERAARPPIGLGLVLILLAGTLGLGAALKAPCADGRWSDGRQYRWLCYSDVVPLLGTEQLSGGRLPYLDACAATPDARCDEYPVLTMYLMRVAGWLSGPTYTAFFWVNAGLLALCALATVVFLYLLVGSRALYFAVAPTLLVYAFMNWDLLAVVLATGALLAFLNRRDALAGVLLGLGAAAKLYPALLIVPLIAQRVHDREPDRAVSVGWGAAASWLAVNLPFAIAAPTGWSEFYRFNSSRIPDFDSLWYLGCQHVNVADVCGNVGRIDLLATMLFVGLFVVVWATKSRIHPGFPRWTLCFPMLVLFLLTNKVYSPQYGLWLLPLFALALPNPGVFVAYQLADAAVFMTRFSWFGRFTGVGGLAFGWFEVALVIRALVLVWTLVAWVRREPSALPADLRGGEAADAVGAAAPPAQAGAPA